MIAIVRGGFPHDVAGRFTIPTLCLRRMAISAPAPRQPEPSHGPASTASRSWTTSFPGSDRTATTNFALRRKGRSRGRIREPSREAHANASNTSDPSSSAARAHRQIDRLRTEGTSCRGPATRQVNRRWAVPLVRTRPTSSLRAPGAGRSRLVEGATRSSGCAGRERPRMSSEYAQRCASRPGLWRGTAEGGAAPRLRKR